MPLPMLYIRGYSGSGKTTLIAKLLSDLSKKYKIIVLKTSKKGFDASGKDTDVLFKSGAYMVIGLSEGQMILRHRGVSNGILKKILEKEDVDLVIVEGLKEAQGPNIALSEEFIDEDTLALYTGDNYGEVLKKVIEIIEIGRIYKGLPGLDCGKCGYTCWELAKRIYNGENLECKVLKQRKELEVLVNGKPLALNPFVVKIFKGVIVAILKELKGYEGGHVVIRFEDRSKGLREEK